MGFHCTHTHTHTLTHTHTHTHTHTLTHVSKLKFYLPLKKKYRLFLQRQQLRPDQNINSNTRPLSLALIHSLTQSCDQINRCAEPAKRTNEMGLRIISLFRSASFP